MPHYQKSAEAVKAFRREWWGIGPRSDSEHGAWGVLSSFAREISGKTYDFWNSLSQLEETSDEACEVFKEQHRRWSKIIRKHFPKVPKLM